MKDIFELVKANLKNPKLYFILFIILIIVMLLFPYIDANYFYYNRVEKRINILEKAINLDEDNIDKDPVLKEEYDSIINEISKQKDGSLGSVFITKNSTKVRMIKFCTGASPLLLIAIICFFIKFDAWWYKPFAFLFFFILSVGIGYVSMILPTVISPVCNYIVMPTLQILVFGMMLTAGNKNKKI